MVSFSEEVGEVHNLNEFQQRIIESARKMNMQLKIIAECNDYFVMSSGIQEQRA